RRDPMPGTVARKSISVLSAPAPAPGAARATAATMPAAVMTLPTRTECPSYLDIIDKPIGGFVKERFRGGTETLPRSRCRSTTEPASAIVPVGRSVGQRSAPLVVGDPDLTFDVERARRETPGCRTRLHFNNAGAGLLPQPVLERVVEHLNLEAAIGGYEAAAKHAAGIEHCYTALAGLLNCRPDEIAVVENATRAWDAAFYAMAFEPGDRILTAGAEYASNYIAY